MPLNEKVILIAGANGGLGTHVTRAFLDAGCRVAGTARMISGADFDHPNFAAFPVELDGRPAAESVANAVRERWGSVDGLVHLVGAFAGGQSLIETDDAVLDQMLDANLRSFVYMAQAVLPVMRAQRAGAVLAIGSRAAVEPQPGLGAYAASKAALISIVQTVARENRAFGISANVILPGTMDTPVNRSAMPQADFGKWVPPQQVAAMLLHLASDAASQVSGAVIPIYGEEL
jgi:NAD(P)-dependent dehydrogenase (short-subunit alcohol dehydrogenase family)